jgi:hypothetical protein
MRQKREKGLRVVLSDQEHARWQETANQLGWTMAQLARYGVDVLASQIDRPRLHKATNEKGERRGKPV